MKVRSHSNPKFIQREQGDREDKILTVEIGHFMMADKDKDLNSHKIDEEIVIEGELIDKIIVEIIVEIVVDKISEGILVMTEIDQEKEALHPEGMIIDAITVQIQGLGIG